MTRAVERGYPVEWTIFPLVAETPPIHTRAQPMNPSPAERVSLAASRSVAGRPLFVGDGLVVTADYAVVRGNGCTVTGSYADVYGNNNTCTGDYCHVYGDDCVMAGNYGSITGMRITVAERADVVETYESSNPFVMPSMPQTDANGTRSDVRGAVPARTVVRERPGDIEVEAGLRAAPRPRTVPSPAPSIPRELVDASGAKTTGPTLPNEAQTMQLMQCLAVTYRQLEGRDTSGRLAKAADLQAAVTDPDWLSACHNLDNCLESTVKADATHRNRLPINWGRFLAAATSPSWSEGILLCERYSRWNHNAGGRLPRERWLLEDMYTIRCFSSPLEVQVLQGDASLLSIDGSRDENGNLQPFTQYRLQLSSSERLSGIGARGSFIDMAVAFSCPGIAEKASPVVVSVGRYCRTVNGTTLTEPYAAIAYLGYRWLISQGHFQFYQRIPVPRNSRYSHLCVAYDDVADIFRTFTIERQRTLVSEPSIDDYQQERIRQQQLSAMAHARSAMANLRPEPPSTLPPPAKARVECQWPGEPEIAKEGELLCTLCTERAIATIVRPCNHAVMCVRCSAKLGKRECPICRGTIGSIERVYFS